MRVYNKKCCEKFVKKNIWKYVEEGKIFKKK